LLLGLKSSANQIPTVTKTVIKDAAVCAAVIKMEIQPKDPSKGHFYISLVKSIIRIGAGGCLIQGNLFFAGFLLIFAEILGIAEELV
jgi:hypothetical protein